MLPVRVFIGFDPCETVAYHVLAHSIMRRSSVPVSITPVDVRHLEGIYTRERDPKQSNEFSFSRFLVPYLSDYVGRSVFMDCDMLMLGDIKDLLDEVDPLYAVSVVKHDYTPKHGTKYLGNVQYQYPRKNWSSVMVFNNYLCRQLTPEYVNTATGLELHRFKWLENRGIGELDPKWNHLVGEYEPNPDAKLVHYTVGGPWFHEYRDCEFSMEWFRELGAMQHCEQLPAPKLKVSER